MRFPDVLRGSVWHTTIPDRFTQIVKSKLILPEPNIPDSERWGTRCGENHYPYSRSINGISLFDFRDFDEHQYQIDYPVSNWREFVPCSHRDDEAIWIEMDLLKISRGYIEAEDLLTMWKESGNLARHLMPMIESCHVGPIAIKDFSKVLLYRKSSEKFEEL